MGTTSWLLIGGAVLYIWILQRIDRKEREKHSLTDEEYLTRLARLDDTSEFDIFLRAAAARRLPERTAALHFKSYLRDGSMPHYVTDCIREARKQLGEISAGPYYGGGNFISWMK